MSPQCAGHIHIGADYLTTKESWLYFAELWSNLEMAFYAMSNKEGEAPRKNIENFAAPVSDFLELYINNYPRKIETVDDIKKVFRKSQQNKRHFGINFLNIGKSKNTIEFRLPNGTLDADTWIQNINLFGGLIKVSEELAQIELRNNKVNANGKIEHDKTPAEVEKIECLAKIKDEKIPYMERVEAFLTMAIPKEKRDLYRRRYKVNIALLEQDKDFYRIIASKIVRKPVDFQGIFDRHDKDDLKEEDVR